MDVSYRKVKCHQVYFNCIKCVFLHTDNCSFTRLLGSYKKSVRNNAHPEGSIMEAHLAYESSTFCSMYLCDVETPFT